MRADAQRLESLARPCRALIRFPLSLTRTRFYTFLYILVQTTREVRTNSPYGYGKMFQQLLKNDVSQTKPTPMARIMKTCIVTCRYLFILFSVFTNHILF